MPFFPGHLLVIFFVVCGALMRNINAEDIDGSYRAPRATLDAIESCSTDNWGMPHQKRPPYHTTYKKNIQQACKAQFEKHHFQPIAHVLENATINYYKNNADFDNFVGLDLVPDNHELYRFGSIWGHNLEYRHIRRDYMKSATCNTKNEDGSQWTVTRVGPFRTTVRL
jgi:hypothetical protein